MHKERVRPLLFPWRTSPAQSERPGLGVEHRALHPLLVTVPRFPRAPRSRMHCSSRSSVDRESTLYDTCDDDCFETSAERASMECFFKIQNILNLMFDFEVFFATRAKAGECDGRVSLPPSRVQCVSLPSFARASLPPPLRARPRPTTRRAQSAKRARNNLIRRPPCATARPTRRAAVVRN